MSLRTLTNRPGSVAATFNDLFEPWNDWFSESRLAKTLSTPKVNIKEDEKQFSLDVAAPGLHKSDFKINVEGDMLTVSAESEKRSESKDEKSHREEYNYSSFSRSFTLPEEVAKDKIEASYDGGILKIALPKIETKATKTASAIEVK